MTVATALVPRNESFQGIPLRLVTVDGKEMMPVADIAKSLNMDRGNLTRLLRHNERFFLDEKRVVKLTTPRGAQSLVCISKFGAIGLLYKVDASHSKIPQIEDRIIAFQRWATELIQKEMQIQTKLPDNIDTIKPAGWSSVASEYLKFAKVLSEDMGIPLALAQAKALSMAQKETGIDFSGFSRLLPPVGINDGDVSEYMSATEIAVFVDPDRILRGKNVNKYLENHGYVYRDKDAGRYALTEKGLHFGKVFPYLAGNTHVGYYIRWRKDVIYDSGMLRKNSGIVAGI